MGTLPPPMAHAARNLPWSDWAEWERCYELLYADFPSSVRKGVQIIGMWQSSANCPVPVGATAEMLRLLYNTEYV